MGKRGRTTTKAPADDVGFDDDAFEETSLEAPPLGDVQDDFDLESLNNPEVTLVGEPPLLGGRTKTGPLLGPEVETIGTPTSPNLFASAAQWPSIERWRVWKIEMGSPILVGEIGANCSPEEFITRFYETMPKAGAGPGRFELRGLNSHGSEVGPRFTKNISDFHTFLVQLREQKAQQAGAGGFNGMFQVGDQGGVQAISEELGRVFDGLLQQQAEQTESFRESLEQERAAAQEARERMSEERVRFAMQQGSAVEKMAERLMAADKARADEALKSQSGQSQFMMTALAQMAEQGRRAAQDALERQQAEEKLRQDRERAYFERLRVQEADQRKAERDEQEQRRRNDLADWEARRERERQELAAETQRRDKAIEERMEALRLENQARIRELELRRAEVEAQNARIAAETTARLEAEKLAWEQKVRLEREERDARIQAEREERERRDRQEREERERRDREREEREERRREELREDLRRREEAAAREDARRREELAAAEARRREELAAAEARRQAELQLQLKQLETAAAQNKEHATHMLQMAQIERDAQRTAVEARERQEREAREIAEKQRERAHAAEMTRLDREHQAAREHQERLATLQREQASGGFGRLGELVGLDSQEVLKRIFTAGEDGGWAEAIPKTLGALAEAWARAQNQGGPPPRAAVSAAEMRQIPAQPEPMITIQTPDGPRSITQTAFRTLQEQARQAQRAGGSGRGAPVPTAPGMLVPPPALPTVEEGSSEAGSDSQSAEPAATPVSSPTPAPPPAPTPPPPEYLAAQDVECLKRAQAAGMKLGEARKARTKIRKLVAQLAKEPEDQWRTTVTGLVMTAPEIFSYLEAVSVWAALAETKVDPDIACRMVLLIQEADAGIRSATGATDPLLPYTEADLQAFQARKAAETASAPDSSSTPESAP